MADPDWIEMQATANLYGWQLDERRLANLNDPEVRGLVNVGLLVIVDENTAVTLPLPAKKGGCGCGH